MAIDRRSRSSSWRPSFDQTAALLQRLVLLAITGAVCFSALVFPFRLPDRFFLQVEGMPVAESWWSWLYHTQLRSMLVYTHSPLVLKEAVAQGFLLAAALGFLVVLVMRTLARETRPLSLGERLREWGGNPVAWTVLLLGYLGVTVLISPTFHYSLRTWFAFSLGVVIPLALFTFQPGSHFTTKFMVILLGCGTIIGGIALLQHLGLTRWFLPGYDDPRNRMSSLIGHNTGMSSWLMFPLSFALYFAHMSRRRWARYVAVAHVLMFGFVILAAQSRAIWVLGAAVLAVNGMLYFRLQRRRLTRRVLLVVACCLLGLIALQTVAPKINPFARTPMSFFERMRRDVLNPQQLMRETRLRILAVSFAELVARKPVFGTGFGTFQWYYPPAQGRYFQKNISETKLGFTTKRTDLAHNDYLQLLVETGLLGVALLAVPAFLLLRSARRGYVLAGEPRSKGRLLALATPTAAVAVHALVDFPFHVAPIALIAAACLGLCAAAGARHSSGEEIQELLSEDVTPPIQTSSIRWKPVVLFGLLVFSCFWMPFASRDLIYRELASDIFMSDASNWLRSFRTVPASQVNQQMAMLHRAQPIFRRAIHLNVFNGAAYEGQSSLFASRGNLLYNLGRRTLQQGDADTAAKYLDAARKDMELAITAAENQMKNGELFYHFTYYLIGTAYRTLWLLKPDPADVRQMNYLKSARTAFELAIETNIADTASLSALVDLLDTTPLKDPAAANRYLALIFRVDEEYGKRTYLEPAVTLAAEGNAEAGVARLQRLAQRLPELSILKAAFAWCYFYASVWLPPELDRIEVPPKETLGWRKEKLAPGLAYLAGLEATEEDERQEQELLKGLYAAAQLNFEGARNLAEPLVELDVRARALRDMAIEALTSTTLQRPDLAYERYKGLYSVYFRSGEPKKEGSFKVGIAATSTRLEMREILRVLHMFKANGWNDVIRKMLEVVKPYYPVDARLKPYEAQAATE